MHKTSRLARFGDFALLVGAWSLACAAFCFALNLDPFAVFAFCVVTFCALVVGLILLVFQRPAIRAGTTHRSPGAVTFAEILESASDDGVASRRAPERAYRLMTRSAHLWQVRGFSAPVAILAAVLFAMLTAGVLPATGNRLIAISEIVALGVLTFVLTTLWFAFIALASQKRRLRWPAYLAHCWRAQL